MTNTLISKIAAASIAVGALATDKTNTAQNYKYISADKILERAGDALAQAGVMVIPSITFEETVQVDYTDNYGKAKSRFDATVHFAMVLADGENQLEVPWRGRGNDYAVPDKALYKAITSGHKYFLMKLLNIGVGNEDGEHETEQHAASPVVETRQQAPQPPAPGQRASDALDTPQGASVTPTEADGTPPHQRLWGQGMSVFGPDWDMARGWVIEKWTEKTTGNTRTSASDLSDDERDQLADYIKTQATALQKIWPGQKKVIERRNMKVAA